MIACRVKLMLHINSVSSFCAHLAYVQWNGVEYASYEDDDN